MHNQEDVTPAARQPVRYSAMQKSLRQRKILQPDQGPGRSAPQEELEGARWNALECRRRSPVSLATWKSWASSNSTGATPGSEQMGRRPWRWPAEPGHCRERLWWSRDTEPGLASASSGGDRCRHYQRDRRHASPGEDTIFMAVSDARAQRGVIEENLGSCLDEVSSRSNQ